VLSAYFSKYQDPQNCLDVRLIKIKISNQSSSKVEFTTWCKSRKCIYNNLIMSDELHHQCSSKHRSRHLQEGARESPLCFPQTVNLNVATATFAKTLELLQHMMQLIQESQSCVLNPSCANLRTKIIKYIFILKYQYYYCISFPQISHSRIQQCLIKFKTHYTNTRKSEKYIFCF
jgi:hypothetical protein